MLLQLISLMFEHACMCGHVTYRCVRKLVTNASLWIHKVNRGIYVKLEVSCTPPRTNERIHARSNAAIVSFPDPTLKEGKGLVYIERYPGPQDAACHVIGMTMHRFGMATHQPLSHACSELLVCEYSTMSHDSHGYTTWHESDWCARIQKWNIIKPKKTLNVDQTLSSLRVGSGNETNAAEIDCIQDWLWHLRVRIYYILFGHVT